MSCVDGEGVSIVSVSLKEGTEGQETPEEEGK